VLKLLARTEPGKGCDDPGGVLLGMAGGRRSDLAILLSDMLCPEAEMEATLRALATMGEAPLLLQVVSPDDLEPDLTKPQRLIDAETGEAVEIPGGADVARAWATARDAWLADLEGRCRRLGIRHLRIRTDTPVADLFRDQLRRAGVVVLGDRG